MQPKIVVIGSANTDMVVRTERIPSPGETVLGGEYQMGQGGKGANQAVAAARLGGEVTFVARLGRDALGRESYAAYQAEGINLDFLIWDETGPSGVALIIVNQAGENIIAVAPGANAHLSPADIQAAEPAIRNADCLLLQLEIPLQTVQAAVDLAARHQVRVILNPAPAAALPSALLSKVDLLTPNETEAALLAEVSTEQDPAQLGRLLRQKYGVRQVVITLGKAGALICGDRAERLPAFAVRPVDTVGAGDAFNGSLAVALGRGADLRAAVRFANAAAALSTTRPGAQSAMATAAEVDGMLTGLHPLD